MNFEKALKALQEGKKIRRDGWREGHFWKLDEKNDELIDSDGNKVKQWRILKEEKKPNLEYLLTATEKLEWMIQHVAILESKINTLIPQIQEIKKQIKNKK